MNASICGANWGLVQFESLDSSFKHDLDLSPVSFDKISSKTGHVIAYSKLNQFMDHRSQNEIDRNP